ncbi:hypothetical protein XENORESO_021767 [Xenotaenia resolanae]|uniref:Uncharacterized protein n=1 Tax=Xenotaenia resolanae TaxID=208358 RepID=A0ABV0VS41_9TELE
MVEPLATPGPSWADADSQLMSSTFPLLQTDEVCDGLAISRSFPEGNGDEEGAESEDSELMLSDDEDEDSTILVSRRKAAKPLAADDDSKPGALCPLDLDVQDVQTCGRKAEHSLGGYSGRGCKISV